MRDHFHALADELEKLRQPDEVALLSFAGEQSDFVRLNVNRVRQAGSVTQHSIELDLIEGGRHATGGGNVTGDPEWDRSWLRDLVERLRAQRSGLPEDPHLLYATEVRDTDDVHVGALPDAPDALDRITRAARGLDLVGIWASGHVYAGLATSFGQRNWYHGTSFSFDWSCYHQEDKAVKCTYGGLAWDDDELERRMAEARAQLGVLARPSKTIPPGRYRAYLAPAALRELLGMLAWGGFGLKSHRTLQTPLLKMLREGRTLHPSVTLSENRVAGLAPRFTAGGFIKADRVTLIEAGRYQDCLVSPRSAKEYGEPVNSGVEFPEALDMAAGEVAADEVAARLGTGLHVGNLWYCNYSDRNECRITGMTRFACFWVEDGAIRAPVNVMRFDDSIYRMLGENLLGLTRERELFLETNTYGARSTASMHLPGALVDDFTLTL
jgi:predicted Zn-dependent protease